MRVAILIFMAVEAITCLGWIEVLGLQISCFLHDMILSGLSFSMNNRLIKKYLNHSHDFATDGADLFLSKRREFFMDFS